VAISRKKAVVPLYFAEGFHLGAEFGQPGALGRISDQGKKPLVEHLIMRSHLRKEMRWHSYYHP
jgi:hypothetical protein